MLNIVENYFKNTIDFFLLCLYTNKARKGYGAVARACAFYFFVSNREGLAVFEMPPVASGLKSATRLSCPLAYMRGIKF